MPEGFEHLNLIAPAVFTVRGLADRYDTMDGRNSKKDGGIVYLLYNDHHRVFPAGRKNDTKKKSIL
jgi:hypothetical protein